ncbi:MAG TPA: glycosyltransferase family 2 protein [Candidatus Portnoybacteria bacterium]|nr:glycosyltransferase family 2 protein [Candidatus Portnoybacteria bacterium]
MEDRKNNYPLVSIIIVNWQNWSDTQECLESLLDLNYPNYKIVLIDNGSIDNSVEEAKKFIAKYQNKIIIDLIKLPENIGFAGGNNVGIKKTLNGDSGYILLLNNDTLTPDKNFLGKLVDYAEKNKKAGMVSPKIYYASGFNYQNNEGTIWFGGGKINWLKTNPIHLQYQQKEKANNNLSPKLVDWLSGCCVLVSKKMIEDIGLMREDFFLYFEDTDWSLRAREKGWKLAYIPSAWILHKIAQSSGEFSPSYIYYNTRNKFACAWQHNGIFGKAILVIVSTWSYLKQLIKVKINRQREWSLAIKKGIEDFWRKKMGPSSLHFSF